MVEANPCVNDIEGMQTAECPFGQIEYSDEQVICFDEGLFGYENFTKYIIINHPNYQPFQWLVSLEKTDLMFPVIDPQKIIEDYEPHINNQEIWDHLFTIVSIGESKESVTTNLRAPILIQKNKKKAKQVILTDSKYPLRYQVIH